AGADYEQRALSLGRSCRPRSEHTADKERRWREKRKGQREENGGRLGLVPKGSKKINGRKRQAERDNNANEISARKFQALHVCVPGIAVDRIENTGNAKQWQG